MLVTVKRMRDGGAAADGKKREEVLGSLLLYGSVAGLNWELEMSANRQSYRWRRWGRAALPNRCPGGAGSPSRHPHPGVPILASPSRQCVVRTPGTGLFLGRRRWVQWSAPRFWALLSSSSFSCAKCLKNIFLKKLPFLSQVLDSDGNEGRGN